MGAFRLQSSNYLCRQIDLRWFDLKKCLLIAPLEAHATIGRLAAIASSGLELHVVDVSSTSPRFKLNQYPFSEIKSYKYFDKSAVLSRHSQMFHMIANKLRAIGLISESRSVIKNLTIEIERVRPDVVVTYYGPIGARYAKIVKTINQNLPVISVLNLIPSSLDYDKTILGLFLKTLNDELNNYKRIIRKLDFLICSSEKMMEHISAKYGVSKNKMAVLPDYFPKSMAFESSANYSKLPGINLIFLGAPERWGGSLDDIDRQLFELAHSGITIYSGNLADYVKLTNNAFSYQRFSDSEVFSGNLSTYAHQFQASLITYGINKRHQRFKTTLPTRFFSALSAGIPIVIRAGLFDAVEAYVEKYKIGFTYQNIEDLKLKLLDQNAMKIYSDNAVKHCFKYYAESQGADFKFFFDSLLLNEGDA